MKAVVNIPSEIKFPTMIGVMLAIGYLLEEYLNIFLGSNFSGAIFIVLAAGTIISIRNFAIPLKKLGYFSWLIFAILIFFFLSRYFSIKDEPGCYDIYKGFYSLFLLLLLAFSVRVASPAYVVLNSFCSNLILTGVVLFLIAAASGFSAMAILFSSFNHTDPYLEQSHLAMYVLPLIGYRLLIDNSDWLAWFTLALCFIFASSLTLLVGTVAFILIRLISRDISRRTLFIILIVGAIGFVLLIFENEYFQYYSERISGIFQGTDAEVRNISSTVWLNGWSQAFESFIATNGLGVGFNQMGCGRFAYVGMFSELLSFGQEPPLNSNDGSFLTSKLVAELGLLGLIIVIALTIRSIQRIVDLRAFRKKSLRTGENIVFFRFAVARAVGGACLLSYLFVRAGGYFMFPGIISIALLLLPMPKRQ